MKEEFFLSDCLGEVGEAPGKPRSSCDFSGEIQSRLDGISPSHVGILLALSCGRRPPVPLVLWGTYPLILTLSVDTTVLSHDVLNASRVGF